MADPKVEFRELLTSVVRGAFEEAKSRKDAPNRSIEAGAMLARDSIIQKIRGAKNKPWSTWTDLYIWEQITLWSLEMQLSALKEQDETHPQLWDLP